MTLDRVLKTLAVVLGSTTVLSLAERWPIGITIVGIASSVISAWFAQAPIDHAAIADHKETNTP